jgi:hypothetical protein
VREKDVACANSYFLIFLWPDSYFGDALQDAKQLFLSRLSQMTKKTITLEIPGTENSGKKTPSGRTVGRPMVCFEKKQKIKFDYKTPLPPPPPQ